MQRTTQYIFGRSNLSYTQIASLIGSGISVAVLPFHPSDGYRQDLVSMINCIKVGKFNGDGTYKSNKLLKNIFHIAYGNTAIGQVVINDQVIVRFYGEWPLSNFEFQRQGDKFKSVPRDRESIEAAIIRELVARGLTNKQAIPRITM